MKERVLIALVDMKDKRDWPVAQVLVEMEELVRACGAEPVGHIVCPAHPPTSVTLINKGKVEEIAGMVKALDVRTVIFSAELKGHQQRNLEEAFGVKTLDRTMLILDIFARRATSREGKLQVELAQLKYVKPRLVGHYDELSRQGGGIGTLGPGETKLEVDRRRIEERIDRIKKELVLVTRSREIKRKRRQGQHVPLVSLVGYTNAGKSTLLNTLTGAEQVTKNGLFTTLDSLARQSALPNKQKVVFSDTVGFMHDLPHDLIEAFKATLEEVQGADLLLHVLDISDVEAGRRKEAVEVVLKELAVLEKPAILVLNKIDAVKDKAGLAGIRSHYPGAVLISAKEGLNLAELLLKVEEKLESLVARVDVKLPMTRLDLVRLAHQRGDVLHEEYLPEGVHLCALLPRAIVSQYLPASRESE